MAVEKSHPQNQRSMESIHCHFDLIIEFTAIPQEGLAWSGKAGWC
jgi:hypothetical protein